MRYEFELYFIVADRNILGQIDPYPNDYVLADKRYSVVEFFDRNEKVRQVSRFFYQITLVVYLSVKGNVDVDLLLSVELDVFFER